MHRRLVFAAQAAGILAAAWIVGAQLLEAVYATLSGGAVETEADQKLDPPIDFADCGKVRMELSNGEQSPASASMQLVAGDQTQELGTEIFGLDRGTEETVEFAVPALRTLQANGIRVIFHRNPTERNQSTKVAIHGFTLVPRGW